MQNSSSRSSSRCLHVAIKKSLIPKNYDTLVNTQKKNSDSSLINYYGSKWIENMQFKRVQYLGPSTICIGIGIQALIQFLLFSLIFNLAKFFNKSCLLCIIVNKYSWLLLMSLFRNQSLCWKILSLFVIFISFQNYSVTSEKQQRGVRVSTPLFKKVALMAEYSLNYEFEQKKKGFLLWINRKTIAPRNWLGIVFNSDWN